MPDKVKLGDDVASILQSQAPPPDDEAYSGETYFMQLQALAAAVDFWRSVPEAFRSMTERLLAVFSAADVPAPDFSLNEVLSSPEYAEEVLSAGIPKEDLFHLLLTAVTVFLTQVADGKNPTRALMLEAVRAVIRLWLEETAPPPPVAEIYSEQQIARVFAPKRLDVGSLHDLGIRYVFYQPETAPGAFGHDIRGLAFKPRSDLPPAKRPFEPNQLFVLLETGEHIIVPDNALNLAGVNDAEEYEKIPPSLLLQSVLAAPLMVRMGVLSPEQADRVRESFGKITKPHYVGIIDTNAVFPLEQVFVAGASRTASEKMTLQHVTGPSGASVRFIVPDTQPEHVVVLNARLTQTSYYLVSNLFRTNGDADDILLMRNDWPRQLSPYGVYLFPREDALYALLAFPENLVFS